MSLQIVSYNVNGIRAALKKDFATWLKDNNFDIVCLQETKAHKEQVETAVFDELGYHHHWFSAEKKGYSSVATFSKVAPTKVVAGCGMDKYDVEGRILRTDFGDWTILNCYFPSGTRGGIRQEYKMEFLADFHKWVKKLKKKRPKLIVVGDYNIAHNEIDIHNPKSNKNSSGFLPEEREWMTQWLDSGFTDAYRFKNPEEQTYSWWSYRSGARKNNKGWRIDYQSVSDNMKDKIINARQLNDAVHSDHCPVWMEIDL